MKKLLLLSCAMYGASAAGMDTMDAKAASLGDERGADDAAAVGPTYHQSVPELIAGAHELEVRLSAPPKSEPVALTFMATITTNPTRKLQVKITKTLHIADDLGHDVVCYNPEGQVIAGNVFTGHEGGFGNCSRYHGCCATLRGSLLRAPGAALAIAAFDERITEQFKAEQAAKTEQLAAEAARRQRNLWATAAAVTAVGALVVAHKTGHLSWERK